MFDTFKEAAAARLSADKMPPINPDYSWFPGMPLVVHAAGSIKALVIIGIVVGMLVAAGLYVWHATRGSNRVAEARSGLAAGVLASFAVGAAVPIVLWAVGQGAKA